MGNMVVSPIARYANEASSRGIARGDSEAVLVTRRAVLGAEASTRTLTESNDVDTPTSVSGKRGRPPPDAVEHLNCFHVSQDERCRGRALRSAVAAVTGAVMGAFPAAES